MMLHRHFDNEQSKNITKSEDLMKEKEFVSEVFPPDDPVEAPKRKPRAKKAE